MKIIKILLLITSYSIAQNYGNWIELDSMHVERIGHALVELPNGNILVSGNGVDSTQSNAEIYDFTIGKWRMTTPMNVPRVSHALILVNTGKVLAIGGYKEQSCELFDPVSETWSMTDSIPTFRWFNPSVTELANGNILVTGGGYIDTTTWDDYILSNAEIYNIATESWGIATPMNIKRKNHSATLLLDGRVLITGGFNKDLELDDCEIYNPDDNTWTQVAPLSEARNMHSAILLKNGNVFVSGGNLKSCEVYDVNENQWFSVDDMLAYRTGHKIYYISKIDKLFILGGEANWEIYDPINLTPVYKGSFPTNIFLRDNNLQMSNENIFVAGGEEYEIPDDGLPYTWPSKRSWTFDVITSINEDNDNQTKGFKLMQNYPNPFNGQTQIYYSIPSKGEISIKVYNSLGQEIEELFNGYRTKGSYIINWKPDNITSGVYLVVFQTPSQIITNKTIYLK